MNLENLNNKIVIIKDESKDSFLKYVSSINKLINIKIITLSELKRKYLFDYDKETIYYVSKKYNVIPNIAKIYIENLYYINKKVNNDKVHFLYDLKEDLINKKLLKFNTLFKKFLINKEIVLYDLEYVDKFYLNIFDEIGKKSKIIKYNTNKLSSVKKLYSAIDEEEEIVFVASQICELINNNIDINNIKIANVNENYNFIIKKIFKQFNIPVNLNIDQFIRGTKIVKKFKELYESDINKTLNNLKKYLVTKSDNDIYNQIINVLNSYAFTTDYNDIKEFVFNDIDSIKIKGKKYKNAVNIIDIENDIINDEYIFLINYNEGVIPFNHKDEDYLNDKIKIMLNISTSSELNKLSTLNLQKRIKQAKNLIVSYVKNIDNKEAFCSSSYSNELFIDENIKINYNYSNAYNKLKLIALKDEYNKFGTISDDLIILNTKYKEKYLSYDNKYKKIDPKDLYKSLGEKLTLSYSSMDEYYKCKFKYYIDYVLRVNKFEDTFEMTIGNIFHKILSECFVENYDFENSWKREVNDSNYKFNNMETFFLGKLKDELILIIDTIKKQLEYTSLTKSMYEKEVLVDIDSKLNVKFKGYIDKILYDEFNNKTIVAIIDYKTGNPILDIGKVKYGIDMQLPVYIYLVKHMKEIKNATIGGFYLQKILNTNNDINERIDNLKLQGYSNSNSDILKYVDSSYNCSKVIKGLKVSSNGFYSYSKVISDDEINDLSCEVEDKIINASKDILDASFDINPKEINNELIGCKYCKYKDICYMNNKDIVKLGGDDNE